MKQKIIKYLNTGMYSKELEGEMGKTVNEMVRIMREQMKRINNKETIEILAKYGKTEVSSKKKNRSQISVGTVGKEIAVSQNVEQPDFRRNEKGESINKGRVLKYKFKTNGEITQVSYADLALESLIGDSKEDVIEINKEFSGILHYSEKTEEAMNEFEEKSKGILGRIRISMKKIKPPTERTIAIGDIRRGIKNAAKKIELRANMQLIPTVKTPKATIQNNNEPSKEIKRNNEGR